MISKIALCTLVLSVASRLAVNAASVTKFPLVKRSSELPKGNLLAKIGHNLPNSEVSTLGFPHNVHEGQSQVAPEYMNRHASLRGLSRQQYEQVINDAENYQAERTSRDSHHTRNHKTKGSRRRGRNLQSQEAEGPAMTFIDPRVASTPIPSQGADNADSKKEISPGEAAAFFAILGSTAAATAPVGYGAVRSLTGWDVPSDDEEDSDAHQRPARVAMQPLDRSAASNYNNSYQNLHKRGYYTHEGQYIPDYDYASIGVKMPQVYGQDSFPPIPLSDLRNPLGYVDQYAPLEEDNEIVDEQASSSSASSSHRGRKKSNRRLLDSPAMVQGNGVYVNGVPQAIPEDASAGGYSGFGTESVGSTPHAYNYDGSLRNQPVQLHQDSSSAKAITGAFVGAIALAGTGGGLYYLNKYYQNRKAEAGRRAVEAPGDIPVAPISMPRDQAPLQRQPPASARSQEIPGHHLDVDDTDDFPDELRDTKAPSKSRRPEGGKAGSSRGNGGGGRGVPHERPYLKRSLSTSSSLKTCSSSLRGRKDLFCH